MIIINEAEDKNEFEDRVAYMKAFLIQEYIDRLNVSQKIKNKVRKEVIKKLQMT